MNLYRFRQLVAINQQKKRLLRSTTTCDTGNMVYVASHAGEQFHIPATFLHSRMNHSPGKMTEDASLGAESAVSCVQTSGGQLRGHSAS